MAFIQTTSPDEADDAVAAMYRRQQSSWGYVPNYAKVFSHRPEVMARWAALLAEIKRPMDSRRFELVTFAAAHELRNSACTLAHGKKLRDFFSDDEIVSIAAGQSTRALTDGEQAMLRFARRIARDAAQVTQDDVEELKRTMRVTDAEVFDIAAAAAARSFFAKLLDALGVEMDSPFLALDLDFRRPLTVGRPVDHHACRVMPLSPRRAETSGAPAEPR